MSYTKIQSYQHMYALFPKSHSLRIGLLLGRHGSKDNERIKHFSWLGVPSGRSHSYHAFIAKGWASSSVFWISGCVRIFTAYKC